VFLDESLTFLGALRRGFRLLPAGIRVWSVNSFNMTVSSFNSLIAMNKLLVLGVSGKVLIIMDALFNPGYKTVCDVQVYRLKV